MRPKSDALTVIRSIHPWAQRQNHPAPVVMMENHTSKSATACIATRIHINRWLLCVTRSSRPEKNVYPAILKWDSKWTPRRVTMQSFSATAVTVSIKKSPVVWIVINLTVQNKEEKIAPSATRLINRN
jgi:hypothetical protein